MKQFIFFILFTTNTFAATCTVIGPEFLGLGLDPKEGSVGFFNPKNDDVINPTFSISNCSGPSRNKFFELRVGILTDDISNSSSTGSFVETWKPLNCSFKGSEIKNQSQLEKIKIYKEKRKFLTECTQIHVTDLGSRKIKFPKNQKFCNPIEISPREVIINGLDCYFENQGNSSFIVDIKVKEECKDKGYFNKLGIDLQEFTSNIEFLMTNDSKGRGLGAKILNSSTMMVKINPNKDHFPVTYSYLKGLGSLPLRWVVPDINLGNISLKESRGRTEVLVPFIVDNRCEETCIQGACSSPCHYTIPVSGEVSLYKVLGNKDELITIWYNGGLASANWQGVVKGLPYYLPGKLESGERYKIEVKFRDPFTDFKFLKRSYKSLIGGLGDNLLGDVKLGGTFGQLPTITAGGVSIENISGGLGSGKMNFSSLGRAVKSFHRLLSISNWPPLYEFVCDKNQRNCQNPETERYNVRLVAEFDLVNQSNTSQPISRGEVVELGFSRRKSQYKLANIIFKRDSKFVSNFQKEMKQMPSIKCIKPKPKPIPIRPENINTENNNNETNNSN